MHVLGRWMATLVVLVGLSFPTAAFAIGIPFGGYVTSVLPCLNGGIWETIAGVRGGAFVWTPFTRTYLYYQIRPGVYQLGLADIPYPCVESWTPFIYIPGFRMQIVGTSLKPTNTGNIGGTAGSLPPIH